MPAFDTLRRLLHAAPHPDGQATTLEATALQNAPVLSGQPHRVLRRPETVITTALGQKVLHGWMQNRFQTRYPLTLNLRNETPAAAALVVEAVRYALCAVDAGAGGAAACGGVPRRGRRHAAGGWRTVAAIGRPPA